MVGKTLNSTGRVMYIETSSTITEMVILALIRKSSRNDGSGAIIAMTMPSTASGTLISARFPNRDSILALAGTVFPCVFGARPRALGELGVETAGAETGVIWGVAAMPASVGAFALPSGRPE